MQLERFAQAKIGLGDAEKKEVWNGDVYENGCSVDFVCRDVSDCLGEGSEMMAKSTPPIFNPFIYWGCPECPVIEMTSRHTIEVKHEHAETIFNLIPYKTGSKKRTDGKRGVRVRKVKKK